MEKTSKLWLKTKLFNIKPVMCKGARVFLYLVLNQKIETFRFDEEYEFDYEKDFLGTFRFDYECGFDKYYLLVFALVMLTTRSSILVANRMPTRFDPTMILRTPVTNLVAPKDCVLRQTNLRVAKNQTDIRMNNHLEFCGVALCLQSMLLCHQRFLMSYRCIVDCLSCFSSSLGGRSHGRVNSRLGRINHFFCLFSSRWGFLHEVNNLLSHTRNFIQSYTGSI